MKLTPLVQHCAQTLQDFNGGASCIQIYVNQHDFFINRIRESSDSNDQLSVFSCCICSYISYFLDGSISQILTQGCLRQSLDYKNCSKKSVPL